jgi:hypothetical protein
MILPPFAVSDYPEFEIIDMKPIRRTTRAPFLFRT